MIGTVVLAAALQHWLVVNDIHLDPFSTAGIRRGADTTAALWKIVVPEMRRDVPQARVVVLGGDMLAHHFPALAYRAHVSDERAALDTQRTIARDLGAAFPSAQFLVAEGNNDDPCGDYHSETDGPYTRALGRIWGPLVDRGNAAPRFAAQFARGGYYTARLPIRSGEAIVLNSVFWSFVYRGGCLSHPRDPGRAEMQWLQSELQTRTASEPTVLLMHIPPGYDAESTMLAHRFLAVPFLRPGTDRRLLGVLADHAGSLRAIFGAHTHRYDFRLPANIPMLLGSSISPIFNNNPAFYDVTVDSDGAIRDIVPYVYGLDARTWKRERSFDTMYGVASFDAANLRHIAERIRDDASERAVWKRAYDAWSRSVGDLDNDPVPFACAQAELGAGFAACAHTSRRTHAAEAAVAIAAVVVLGGIVAVFALRRRRKSTGR